MCVIMMLIKGKEKERRRYISLKLYMIVCYYDADQRKRERKKAL